MNQRRHSLLAALILFPALQAPAAESASTCALRSLSCSVNPVSALGLLFLVLAVVFVLVRSVVTAHRGAVTTGMEGLVGETGSVIEDFSGGTGRVMVRGESWEARCGEVLNAGDAVTVTGSRGMVLTVKGFL